MTAKDELARANARLSEQTTGEYPFKLLQAEASRLRPPLLDHATYIGPFAIKESESQGRGLFTTKAVKAGDLLFCEKAIAHAFVDDAKGCSKMAIVVDADNTITMGGQADLININIQKVYRNPSLLPTSNDMYHGSYQPVGVTEVDGKPVVDSFLIRRIITLNSFGCPLSSIDPPPEDKSIFKDVPTDFHHSAGLWATSSYINHSCVGNAHRSFIGNMMIARATEDLEPDTEITWPYLPPAGNYAERQKELKKQWGFDCDCVICLEEKCTGQDMLDKRHRSVTKVEGYLKRGKKDGDLVGTVETFLDEMGETYEVVDDGSERGMAPRLAVWGVIQKVVGKVMQMPEGRKKQVELLRFIREAFSALGYVIKGGELDMDGKVNGMLVVKKWGVLVDGAAEFWVSMRDVYRLIAPEVAVAVEGYARAAYRMVIGENETFEE